MINSMTGYAAAESGGDTFSVSVEIRSFNNRHLDTILRLPHAWLGLESRIKAVVGDRLARGRVEVRVDIQDVSAAAEKFEVDTIRAGAYAEALKHLAQAVGAASAVPLELVARVDGVIRPADTGKDLDACWQELEPCLRRTLDALADMRAREGRFMAEDFARRLDFLEAHVQKVAEASRHLLELYRDRLKRRIGELTQGMVEIDPARIVQEAAFLADRSDISEEIVRLRSHVEQFRHLMETPEAAGRRLNFLLQEMNRELNTIGSKTEKAAVAHMVVEMKAELEKIREQVQNVE
jgi:uncharacterized protein (TIGR00255 family)